MADVRNKPETVASQLLERMVKAREVIEPALTFEAAVNGTEQDFADLETSIARMRTLQAQRDQQAFLDENRSFHGIIPAPAATRCWRCSGQPSACWPVASIMACVTLWPIRVM